MMNNKVVTGIDNEEIFGAVYGKAYGFEQNNKRTRMPLDRDDIGKGRKENKRFNKKNNVRKYSA